MAIPSIKGESKVDVGFSASAVQVEEDWAVGAGLAWGLSGTGSLELCVCSKAVHMVNLGARLCPGALSFTCVPESKGDSETENHFIKSCCAVCYIPSFHHCPALQSWWSQPLTDTESWGRRADSVGWCLMGSCAALPVREEGGWCFPCRRHGVWLY